jgi:predicted ribosome quality control (RQC) complex YloA/Tae2 family protein
MRLLYGGLICTDLSGYVALGKIKYKYDNNNNNNNNNNTPEPMLESANVFIYRNSSTITDKTVYFNKADTALIGRENETGILIDTAVSLTSNLPKIETEILRSIKIWP